MKISYENWCQEATALDANDHPVYARDKTAVRWCAYGHLRRAFPTDHEFDAAVKKLEQAIQPAVIAEEQPPPPPGQIIQPLGIANWNDDPDRTAEEVQAAFEKAGIVLPD